MRLEILRFIYSTLLYHLSFINIPNPVVLNLRFKNVQNTSQREYFSDILGVFAGIFPRFNCQKPWTFPSFFLMWERTLNAKNS